MKSVFNEQGKLVSSEKEILQQHALFYKKLYMSDSKIEFKDPEKPEVKIDEETKTRLDSKITIEEIGLV